MTTISKPYMQEEVIAGIQLLDEFFKGNSWRRRVDPSKLDMYSMTGCILGQIFGHYARGVHFLGLCGIDAVQEYGFMAHPCSDGTIPKWAWVLLKKAWVIALTGEENDCTSSTSTDGQRMDHRHTQAARVLHAGGS